MNNLIEKYYPVINGANKSLWNDYAETLDTSIEYLKNKELSLELKVASTYVVKQLFLDDDNFKSKNITNIIDDFINYYNNEYDEYMKGFALISNQFDADLCFFNIFIKKHQQ